MKTREQILQEAYHKGFEKVAGAKWRTLANLTRILKSRDLLGATRSGMHSRGELLSGVNKLLGRGEDLPGFDKLMARQRWQPAAAHPLTADALTLANLPLGPEATGLSRRLKVLLRAHKSPFETARSFKGLSRRIGPVRELGIRTTPVADLQGVHASPLLDSVSNYLTIPANRHGYGLISAYKPTPRQLYTGDFSLERGGTMSSIPRLRHRLMRAPQDLARDTTTSGNLFGYLKDFFYETAADPSRRVGTVLARTSTPGEVHSHSRISVAEPTPRVLKALNSLATRYKQ